MLKLQETTTESGELKGVFLSLEAGALTIADCESTFSLPEGALDAVMLRFGAPLDPAERIVVVATLDLGPDHSLCQVRHLSGYDVIARDYVVYRAPGGEALCALATTVGAALTHLGRAAHRIRSESEAPKFS